MRIGIVRKASPFAHPHNTLQEPSFSVLSRGERGCLVPYLFRVVLQDG